MNKYKLTITGNAVTATASSLSPQQVESVLNYASSNELEDLHDMPQELQSDVVPGYDAGEGNLLDVYAPLFDDELKFTITDSQGSEAIVFDASQLKDIYEVDEDFEPEDLPAIPDEENPAVLLYLWFVEGGICEFEFASQDIPAANDFMIIPGTISTQDGEYDLVRGLRFREEILEMNFLDSGFTKDVSHQSQLWTLEE